jgi:hypothetical protein
VWVLAGPSRLQGALPRQTHAPATTGVLWNKEEGNVVSVRQAYALSQVVAEQASPGTRTRPSLGPETRARQSPLNSPTTAQAGVAEVARRL